MYLCPWLGVRLRLCDGFCCPHLCCFLQIGGALVTRHFRCLWGCQHGIHVLHFVVAMSLDAATALLVLAGCTNSNCNLLHVAHAVHKLQYVNVPWTLNNMGVCLTSTAMLLSVSRTFVLVITDGGKKIVCKCIQILYSYHLRSDGMSSLVNRVKTRTQYLIV